MTQANTIGARPTTPELASEGQSWPRFSGVMRVARSFLVGEKYEARARALAEALACSPRTAQRILAGQSVNSDTTLAVLTHADIGPHFMAAILERVPESRRAELMKGLTEAIELVRLETEIKLATKTLAEKRAAR